MSFFIRQVGPSFTETIGGAVALLEGQAPVTVASFPAIQNPSGIRSTDWSALYPTSP
jgi:hypothetical protein